MADLNRVCLVGRLTKDCSLKTLSSGTTLCEFSLANNRGWGDNAKVNFFDVKLWGKGAKGVSKYLVKGKRIAVDGELSFESWTTPEGVKRSKIVVTTFEVQLLDSAPTEESKYTAPKESVIIVEDDDVEIPF